MFFRVCFEVNIFRPPFFENLSSFINPYSYFFLFFNWQHKNLLARFRAASVVFSFARITLYKKQVTAIVFAIGMFITLITALMTYGNNIIGYSFTKPLIKYKIFSDDLIFNALLFGLSCIFNEPSIQLKNIFKSKMFHPCAGFLTTNSTSAIH